ncbi:hypothetical protein [Streptomyces sp. NPDC051211]|uniref:hypothetical protein n=1 Tax=Streptomyces sp. NPDC051211 TaxID=3154643 RepID=UPI00344DA2E0
MDAFSGCTAHLAPVGTADVVRDESWDEADKAERGEAGYTGPGSETDAHVAVYREAPPAGDEAVRPACIQSGDVQAVVLHTRKTAEPATVPFHQTVILQHQLLG